MSKPRTKTKRPTFTDQIRRAMVECGKTRYRIAQESGVSEAALSRFVNGKMGLNTASLDALADVVGLKIVICKPSSDETAGSSKGR